MKKTLAILMMLLLLCAAAAGCAPAPQPAQPGGDAPGSQPASESAAATEAAAVTEASAAASEQPSAAPGAGEAGGGKTKLSFWSGIPETMGPQQAMEAYAAEHPNIEFEFVKLGWDDASNTKLDTALMSGVGVDVFTPTRASLEKAEKGLVMDLSGMLAENGIDLLADVGEDVLSTQHDGRYYQIPLSRLPVMWLFNKDMFDAAGIEIPTAGWTVDDLEDIARKLTTADTYGVYLTHNWPGHWYSSLGDGYIARTEILAPDRSASNLLDPRFEYTLGKVLDMQFQDKSMLPYAEAISENYTPSSVLLTQKAAMVCASSYVVRDVKDVATFPHDFVVAFAPPPVQNKGDAILNCWALEDPIQVSAKTENPEEALEFAAWLYGEGVKHFVPFGRFPAHSGISGDEVVSAFFGGESGQLFDRESFEQVMATPVTKTPQNYGVDEISKIITQETEPALVGEMDAAAAIRNADERVNEFLNS
ncbi:MAG: extracellular solute-binding protein [Clostridiales bacterium]|jgi:multiple sugar transport system substrate-binding protein|nr:extracellular solute-binding protein [Clostridiales bacterium]